MAKRCHRNKRNHSDDTGEDLSDVNNETEISEHRKQQSSIAPSTSQQMSLENKQFLKVPGLFTKDPHFHQAAMAVINKKPFFLEASARPSTSNDEDVISSSVNSTDQKLIPNNRDCSTQSNFKAHETKEDFKRKVKSIYPNSSANWNAFLLLTDATGKLMLAAGTNTNPKRRKSPICQQNVIAEPMSCSKDYSTLKTIKFQPGNSGELNSGNIQNNLSMYDAWTQTKHKYKYRHECTHQKHRENKTSKCDTEDLSQSCEITDGTPDRQTSLTLTESSLKTYCVNNSKTVLVKEMECQTLNNSNELKLHLNYSRNIKVTGRIDKKHYEDWNNTLFDPTYIFNESSTESSGCTKTTVVKNTNIPNYLKAQFNNDTHTNYEITSPKKTEDKVLKADNLITSKNETKTPLPPNINISIDGAKESYNVQIQYSDSKHENYTIKTVINKVNSPDAVSENAFIKRHVVHTLKPNCLSHLQTMANIKKNTTTFARRNLPNFITKIPNIIPPSPKRNFFSLPSYAARNHENVAFSPESRRRQVHYRGDSCLLKDPVERDHEIQRLLGIERRHYLPSVSKSQPSWSAMMSKTCSPPSKKVSSSSERISVENPGVQKASGRKIKKHQCQICDKTSHKKDPEVEKSSGEPNYKEIQKQTEKQHKTENVIAKSHEDCYQHKPITINATEYQTLKTSIHEKLRKSSCDRLRPIRKNKKFRRPHFTNINILRTKHNILTSSKPEFGDKDACQSELYNIRGNTGLYQVHQETQTVTQIEKQNPLEISNDCDLVKEELEICDKDCTVLSVQGNITKNTSTKKLSFGVRNVVSLTQLRESRENIYNSAYNIDIESIQNSQKKITENLETSCDLLEPRVIKLSPSICTLFKSKKKVAKCSPNLGNSTFSVDSKETKPGLFKDSRTSHPKTHNDRSFLKRLTKFLTRKKSKDVACQSGGDVWTYPAEATPESSEDSYYINQSLAAMDMSSSIYDTSASHYSRHTVMVARPLLKSSKSFINKLKNYLN